MEIKKGDNVVVIAGKEKGKRGKVLETSPKTQRVVVEGVNVVSKHKKPRSAQDKGGIIKQTIQLILQMLWLFAQLATKQQEFPTNLLTGKRQEFAKMWRKFG